VVVEDGVSGVVALVSGRVPATLPQELQMTTGAAVPMGDVDRERPRPLLMAPAGEPSARRAPSGAQAPVARLLPPAAAPGPARPVPSGAQAPAARSMPSGAQAPAARSSSAGATSAAAARSVPVTPLPERERAELVAVPAQPVDPETPPEDGAGQPYERPGSPADAAGAKAAQPSRGPASGPIAEPEKADASGPQVLWRPPSRLAPPVPTPATPMPLPPRPAPTAGPERAPVAGLPAKVPVPEAAVNGRVPPVARAGNIATSEPGTNGRAPTEHGTVINRAPERAPQRTFVHLDSGERIPVGAFHLLGREPLVSDGDPPAQLVRIEDERLSVSKTHLAFGIDEVGFWVVDRHSTNGSVVLEPGGRRTPCLPWTRQYVPIGSEVLIGQRHFTVERSDSLGPE
jgi:hypothetical protein